MITIILIVWREMMVNQHLAEILFWGSAIYCAVYCFFAGLVGPIIFKIWIIPKIEDQMGMAIRYNEWRYPVPLCFWSWWAGYAEVAWGIVYRWWKYKIKNEIFLGSEQDKGFNSQPYDIRLATPFILILSWIFTILGFLFLIAAVIILITRNYVP